MPFGGLLTVGLISAGTSIFKGITGANAANNAADTQAQAEQKVLDLEGKTIPQANSLIGAGVNGANGTLAGTYGQDMSLLSPYINSGTSALSQLNGLTAAGGFHAPTTVDEQNDPGYQFRLQQGELAQQRSAAGAGGVLGGGEAKALADYEQGAASNEYGNVYSRALGTYDTNFGNLQSLAGLGLNATNTAVGASNLTGTQTAANTLQGANLQSGNLLQGLGISADALTGAANARASGYVGAANAYGGAASSIGGDAQNLLLLNQLLQKSNGSNATTPTFV